MQNGAEPVAEYPLHLARALQEAERACPGEECCDAALMLSRVLTYYLGAVAVGQYSQALYAGLIEADPTLTRSLRSLRRVLPGQWLLWAARGLAATPDGPVAGLSQWYSREERGAVSLAYSEVRDVMVSRLDYGGEYGPREDVSPRFFLELLDQYVVRRGKLPGDVLSGEAQGDVGSAVLLGLRAIIRGATPLAEYQLYAPQQRKLLMGLEAATPMPPMQAPDDAETATLLLYPPGDKPDYTRRPTLQPQRLPLFPLDPLLAYLYCGECDTYHVSALQGVAESNPTYKGLDPQCRHLITPA